MVIRCTQLMGIFLAAICVLGFFCEAAEATVLRDLSLEDLTAQADVVLIGDIGKVRSLRDTKGQIWTETAVEVEKTVKGRTKGDKILIRQQGGTIGDVVSRVDGNARLLTGETALLFLKRSGGFHYTVGMELGKFDVYEDATRERRVRRSSTVPVAKTARDSHGEMSLGHASVRHNGVTLLEILADIRRAMNRRSGGGER